MAQSINATLPPDTPFLVHVHPFRSPEEPNGPLAYAYEMHASLQLPSENALVFIGGLGDGPHSVPYARAVADLILRHAPHLSYSIWEPRMQSSFSAWGVHSLEADVQDLSKLVVYLRSLNKKKIVFFGHSTGCQDCVSYSHLDPDRAPEAEVDAFILQAPVSDRQYIEGEMSPGGFRESQRVAAEMIAAGHGDRIMLRSLLPESSFFGVPVTANRWDSLVRTEGGEDFFSSDLSEQQMAKVWSKITKPLLVMCSEKDECVPDNLNVHEVMHLWETACSPDVWSDLSGVIPEANHDVENLRGLMWMAEAVINFLQRLQQGSW